MSPKRRQRGEEAPTQPIPRETMWEAVQRARAERMAEGTTEQPAPMDDEE
jgi:hypothetical protein